MQKAWEGFVGGNWERHVDVRDFIADVKEQQ